MCQASLRTLLPGPPSFSQPNLNMGKSFKQITAGDFFFHIFSDPAHNILSKQGSEFSLSKFQIRFSQRDFLRPSEFLKVPCCVQSPPLPFATDKKTQAWYPSEFNVCQVMSNCILCATFRNRYLFFGSIHWTQNFQVQCMRPRHKSWDKQQ